MATLRVFQSEQGEKVFLSLQMLKRHHRVIVRRDGHDYLAFVRPQAGQAGELQMVIPDPLWPEASPGEPTRLRPEEISHLEMRLATEDEVWRLVKPLLDALVP
jgi:hypothetical protein